MICNKMTGHNSKTFSCTARGQMCTCAVLEIKKVAF